MNETLPGISTGAISAALEQEKFPSEERKVKLHAAERKVSDLTEYLRKLSAQVHARTAEEDAFEYEFGVDVKKMLFPEPPIDAFRNDAKCDKAMNRVKARLM